MIWLPFSVSTVGVEVELNMSGSASLSKVCGTTGRKDRRVLYCCEQMYADSVTVQATGESTEKHRHSTSQNQTFAQTWLRIMVKTGLQG